MSLRQFLLNHFLLPDELFEVAHLSARPSRADFICPQAFGRNTYSDTAVGAIVNTAREELCHSDDIATFEWLKSQGFDPGQPNRSLAEFCYNLANDLEAVIIGQWEVMYALYDRNSAWYEKNIEYLAVIWPPDEGYLATHGLFLEMKRVADKLGMQTPLLVAHPEHIQRCFFLGKKVFGTTPAIATGTSSNEWFDQSSVQWWTRGKWRWLFYELCLARPHHWIKGWF